MCQAPASLTTYFFTVIPSGEMFREDIENGTRERKWASFFTKTLLFFRRDYFFPKSIIQYHFFQFRVEMLGGNDMIKLLHD